VDLLCIDEERHALVAVEVKSTRSLGACERAVIPGSAQLRPPFQSLPPTLATVHYLQAFLTQLLLIKSLRDLGSTPGLETLRALCARGDLSWASLSSAVLYARSGELCPVPAAFSELHEQIELLMHQSRFAGTMRWTLPAAPTLSHPPVPFRAKKASAVRRPGHKGVKKQRQKPKPKPKQKKPKAKKKKKKTTPAKIRRVSSKTK
jgi:hypothetical protein